MLVGLPTFKKLLVGITKGDKLNSKEIKYLLIIISIFISAVIETDIYLPAFSDMMKYFEQSEESIQKILTWNFIGLCVSGPIYGPFSDSFGRKKPLLISLSLFLFGCIITLCAKDFEWMLIGRVLQGLGSGGCFTLGTAIIFDVFQGNKATDALNKMNMIVPFLMSTAPLLGGYLNQHFGFRSNFLAITICVSICFSACALFLRETLDSKLRVPLRITSIGRSFYRAFTHGNFLRLTGVISLVFSGFLVFLSSAALVFVLEFNVSKSYFPFYQFSLLSAYLGASLTCSSMIKMRGLTFVKKLGIFSVTTSCILLVLVVSQFPKNPLFLTLAMLPYGCGFIWVQTPYVTEAMELLPDMRGISASILTSLRLLITTIILAITAKFYDGTMTPTVVSICLVTGLIVLLARDYEKSKKVSESQEFGQAMGNKREAILVDEME